MVPENTKINIINNIKTSMEMENQNLSANDISLLNDFADNKISCLLYTSPSPRDLG